MGVSGRTRRRNEAAELSCPRSKRTAPISTILALAGSRPVVSVSRTMASSAISGVILSAAIGFPRFGHGRRLSAPCPQHPRELRRVHAPGELVMDIAQAYSEIIFDRGEIPA